MGILYSNLIIRATARGGVCIYYKEPLVIRGLNISHLVESLFCEITIK